MTQVKHRADASNDDGSSKTRDPNNDVEALKNTVRRWEEKMRQGRRASLVETLSWKKIMYAVEQLHPQATDTDFNYVRKMWQKECRILSEESKAEEKVKIAKHNIAVEEEKHERNVERIKTTIASEKVQNTIAFETAAHKRRLQDLNKDLAEASSKLQSISEKFDDAQRMAEMTPQVTAGEC